MTEEITGVDLVKAQIKIAGGASLADLGLGSQVRTPAVLSVRCPGGSSSAGQQCSIWLQAALPGQRQPRSPAGASSLAGPTWNRGDFRL